MGCTVGGQSSIQDSRVNMWESNIVNRIKYGILVNKQLYSGICKLRTFQEGSFQVILLFGTLHYCLSQNSRNCPKTKKPSSSRPHRLKIIYCFMSFFLYIIIIIFFFQWLPPVNALWEGCPSPMSCGAYPGTGPACNWCYFNLDRLLKSYF